MMREEQEDVAEEDPRERERQQHPEAEITQILALLRRNVLVRMRRVGSLGPSLDHKPLPWIRSV